jgi:ankyrin repeat protein
MRAGRFPPLESPSLFLASPSDVSYLRDISKRAFYEFSLGDLRTDDLGLYAYEDEQCDALWDPVPAQEQIPRPDDPLCRGVIAFFGEWIGRPLADGFPLEILDPLDPCRKDRKYRLVHPWQPEAAQSGGFSLTGSTFEVLATLAADRRAITDQNVHVPPLFLCLTGPKEALDEPSVGKARWGNRRLRNHVNEKWAEDDDERSRRSDIITKQLEQLRNFALFLEIELGLVTNFVADEDAAEKTLRKWLEEKFGLAPTQSNRDPFKGLQYYDVEDADLFYGREGERKEAMRTIRTLWEIPEGAKRWYWVRGPSGAGKSSFLRAGLIGHIVKTPPDRETYAHCVIRPNELATVRPDSELERYSPLQRLLERCFVSISEKSDRATDVAGQVEIFNALPDNKKPEWAARFISEALGHRRELASSHRRRRLILGFDQFEEAVDMVCDAKSGPAWNSLIEFVVLLSGMPGILVLATIREDRIGAMTTHPELAKLYGDTQQKSCFIGLPSSTNLSQLIRMPFAGVRDLVLGEDLISTLTDKIRAFSNRHVTATDSGSLLPLISLMLERLYREVARPLIDEHRNMGRPGHERQGSDSCAERDGATEPRADFGRAADAEGGLKPSILTVEKAGNYLKIESAISALAQDAVEEAKGANPNWDETAIGTLLRRLISWSGRADQLFSLPASDWPNDVAAAALARSMKKKRLIVEEEGDRIRLVHEAVIANWPAAQTWLDFERPLLNDIQQLHTFASLWCEEPSAKEVLGLASRRYLAPAARLLTLWRDILDKVPRDPDPEKKAALRDFCLALLAWHNNAGEIVEETPERPPHLHLAVCYGRFDIVRAMLAVVPEAANLPRSDKRTALFYPAFEGNLEMVELLLEHGAGPDVPDEKKWRPVHAASMKGTVNVIARLVEAGATLEAAGAPGGTAPIHLAAEEGRSALLEYLVKQQKVDVDLRDSEGQTPIIRAARSNHAEAVQKLVELGGTVDATQWPGKDSDFGWTALHFAARDGATYALDALIEAGLDPDRPLVNGARPLHLAAYNGNVESVRRLLAKGASPEVLSFEEWTFDAKKIKSTLEGRKTTEPDERNGKFDMRPLHVAIARGHTEVVTLLLDARADVNSRTGSGATPLHLAATHNRHEFIPLLLKNGAKTELRDASWRTPFQEALDKLAFNAARTLLEGGVGNGAPMRIAGATDEENERRRVTPLHMAAGDANAEVLQFLLSQKVNPDVVDWRGWTPLHYAAAAGRDRITERLLQRGASPNVADEAGLTPLHLACRKGAASVVTALLRQHRPNWANCEGTVTPLHLAAHAASPVAVTKLIEAGHPVDSRDPKGLTPLLCAVQAQGGTECVDALLNAGAAPLACGEEPRLNAIQLAARLGNVESIRRLLMDTSISPDAASEDSPPATVLAMRYRQFGAVAALLEAGAALNTCDPDTCRNLIDSYRQQVKRAESLGAVDTRLEALEALFEANANKERPAQITSKPAPTIQQTLSRLLSEIEQSSGATAFFPETTRDSTAWSPIEGEELSNLLKQVSPVDGKYPLDLEATDVQIRALPWYDNVSLVQIRNDELIAQRTRLFFLRDHVGNLYRLNGTSPPIHEVNATAPLKLNEANVRSYLRFFCFFVRGEEGPFYIAETMDDPLIPKATDDKTRKVLEGTVRPVSFEGYNEKGHFLLEGTVLYSNAMFIVHFAVQPAGMIEMLDDDPVAADMPLRLEIFLS